MDQRAFMVADVAGVSTAHKVTVTGAMTGALGWMTQIDWLGVSGFVIAVAGIGINMFFQLRRDRREAAESEARLKVLEREVQKSD